MYDIFFAIYDSESLKSEIKKRFPLAKFCIIDKDVSIDALLYDAQRRSLTKMFWFVNFGYEIKKDFNIDYDIPEWDQKYVHVFKEEKTDTYTGMYLIPKSYHITKNEAEHLFFINKKEINTISSCKKSLDIFFAIYDIEETKQELISRFPTAKFCIIDETHKIQDALYEAQTRSSTKMFWFVEVEYSIKENFDIDYDIPEWDQKYVHVFKEEKTDTYAGVYLIPKSYHITKKEAEHLFFINKKEIDTVICYKKGPDIFFAIYDIEETKQELISRFPTAKFCIIDETCKIQDALYQAQQQSSTAIFWLIDIGYSIKENFDIDYDIPEWDQKYVHVFKEEKTDTYAGMYLIPKSYHITTKEAEHLFFINKKEIDTVICYKKGPDIFFAIYDNNLLRDKIKNQLVSAKFCIIDDNNGIQNALYEAQSRSSTEIFWFVDVGYSIKENFDIDYDIPEWDQKYVHVFKEEKTDSYKGMYLIPKSYHITKKEAEHLFFINKKEILIASSRAIDYDRFLVETYKDYLDAKSKTTTDMFYVIFLDLNIDGNFKFDHYIEKEAQHLNYVFKNGNCYDGIFLTSKKAVVTEKEFNSRFLLNRSEVDSKASDVSKYEIIECADYDDYKEKIKLAKTSMAFIVTNNLIVDKFDFDYQVPRWNRDKVYVFKNGKYFDGIFLVSTDVVLRKREFDYRFFNNKIEVDINASTPKSFDIVFISYEEPNADENYQKLIERFPQAKRIHGVKGIHQAHREAAKIVDTLMFWVVDGDAQILDDFNFDYHPPAWDHDTVHVWRSQNPINGLEYGYGGVKLLPTQLTRALDDLTVDMTTSISSKFKAMPEVSNISKFNTDEFNTWRSAFRECVKLSSKVITGQKDTETAKRLEIWCTVGENELYGKFAINGAQTGKHYGSTHRDDPAMLIKINNWAWLYETYQKSISSIDTK